MLKEITREKAFHLSLLILLWLIYLLLKEKIQWKFCHNKWKGFSLIFSSNFLFETFLMNKKNQKSYLTWQDLMLMVNSLINLIIAIWFFSSLLYFFCLKDLSMEERKDNNACNNKASSFKEKMCRLLLLLCIPFSLLLCVGFQFRRPTQQQAS